MPLGALLVGMRELENARFVERLAQDLQAEYQEDVIVKFRIVLHINDMTLYIH